jgi:hypothetical protein
MVLILIFEWWLVWIGKLMGIFHLQMGSQKHIRYVSWDEIFLFFEGDNIGI